MLSKVIAWGADRETARRTLDRALASTIVLGVTTNVAFLRTVLADRDVAEGTIDTGLVERIAERAPPRSTPPHIAAAAAIAQTMLQHRHPRAEPTPPWTDRTGWRMGEPARLTWTVDTGDGEQLTVQFRRSDRDGYFEVRHDGGTIDTALTLVGGQGEIEFAGATSKILIAVAGRTTWIGAEGDSWTFHAPEPIAPGRTHVNSTFAIESPMPGTVVSVLVSAGDPVTAGQPVVVVEAMKMEHTLRASADGIVSDVLVHVGDRVSLKQLLAVVDPAEPSEEH
jgi:acetyl-CoA/propionyl-CoA carboxylase biotin carboxyl carrier protein